MNAPRAALVWCPFPDVVTAREVAGQLLEEKLIACANILPAIESVFTWDGAVSTASECAVLFKTSADRLNRVVEQLGELHPYDTPAIIGWRCDAAHPKTLRWLAGTIDDDEESGRPDS